MGISIQNNKKWSKVLAEQTLSLARKEANYRGELASKGAFNASVRTCDIEQETQVIDALSGTPIDAQSFFETNTFGARPDTCKYIVEFDANGITQLTSEGMQHLARSLNTRTEMIQEELRQINPHATIIHTGTNPTLVAGEPNSWVVLDEQKVMRYKLMDEQTKRENPKAKIEISNPNNHESFIDRASNLTAMTRCTGTQFHFSEKTVEDVIEAHNISIAIASPLIAIFGNSPFVGAVDTGRTSTRVELLRQAEQVRAGLPEPARNLKEYYLNQISKGLPPFICIESGDEALSMTHSAIHTVTRIQVDTDKGTIRNEIRYFDSLKPFKAMQAMLLTFGLLEGFKNKALPTYKESQTNFENAPFGLETSMTWGGTSLKTKDLAIDLIELAQKTLLERGFGKLTQEYLKPLAEEVSEGKTQADIIREKVSNLESQAMNRNLAINHAILEMTSI